MPDAHAEPDRFERPVLSDDFVEFGQLVGRGEVEVLTPINSPLAGAAYDGPVRRVGPKRRSAKEQ